MQQLHSLSIDYETYKDDEFVTPLVTQISWTNHLLIMSSSKSAQEQHFHMTLYAKEYYSKRELERQMDSAYYERYMLFSKKLIPESVTQDVRGSILDSYVPEFLDLPEQYSERNLRKAITSNLKQFIFEFGKDDAVVEYALSRSMSSTLVSDYTLHLPDKELLQNKLRELTELALESSEGDEE